MRDITLPTEGEWRRALTDVRVAEQARAGHVPSDADGSAEQCTVSYKLRGERFLAVPEGAIGVAFVWSLVN